MKALTEDFENYEQDEFATSTTIYILQHFQSNLKKNHSEHYLKNTVMDILPVEQPDLYKMISSEVESVVDKIGFNANWFTIDSYLNLWKKHFLEFLNENTKTRGLLEALHTDS